MVSSHYHEFLILGFFTAWEVLVRLVLSQGVTQFSEPRTDYAGGDKHEECSQGVYCKDRHHQHLGLIIIGSVLLWFVNCVRIVDSHSESIDNTDKHSTIHGEITVWHGAEIQYESCCTLGFQFSVENASCDSVMFQDSKFLGNWASAIEWTRPSFISLRSYPCHCCSKWPWFIPYPVWFNASTPDETNTFKTKI